MDLLQTLQIWKKIKTNLQKRFSDIQSTFNSIDNNKNGTIEIDEFTSELETNQGISQDEQIQVVFKLLNLSKNGKITLDEFEKQWTSTDQLIQQEQNRQQFLKQKQQVTNPTSGQQEQMQTSQIQRSLLQQQQKGSAQQFSDLFNSYKSNNSPTKYINIQSEFSINQFNTPPFFDRRQSPLKIMSPPKPEQFPKSKIEAKEDKLREMQRQISNLFNNKNDPKNSTPRLRSNLDEFMNTMKLGVGRRSSGHTFRYETKTQTISPKLLDQVSLQNYAYQFNDMKMQFKQTYSNNRSTNNGYTFMKK